VNGAVKVSAIIVNWNGAHHLRICLPSLQEQTCRSLEVIVVDNHSSDESAAVARDFQVRWLGLDTNSGLAPALNRGAAIAQGDALLFINNDMRFAPGFVAALLEQLEADDKIFATDGMQFNWEGTSREHMSARLVKRQGASASDPELVPGLKFFQRDELKASPVFMGSAACMLVRRTLFEKLGGFDERLTLGYEDVEMCWRAWLHGWKTVYVPGAVCWHRVGASAGSLEGKLMNFRGIVKGRLILACKLLPLRYAVGTWLISVAALGKDLGKLRWRFARDRVKTLVAVAGMLPQILRERRKLFAAAGVTPTTHLEAMLQLSHQHSSISSNS
jgi:GT2 family glycosyltransferase